MHNVELLIIIVELLIKFSEFNFKIFSDYLDEAMKLSIEINGAVTFYTYFMSYLKGKASLKN